MDSETLNLSIDYLGSSGIILSIEQKSALQISLALLKSNEKLPRLHFWGRIRGIYGDYYVAKGFLGDCYSSKRFYYSKDCLNWGLLNPPSETLMSQSRHYVELFTGDPSHNFETKIVNKSEDDDNNEEQLITMKEEDRLACLLHLIEDEVLIAPRKALIKVSGKILVNKSFEGLTLSEASQLYNFMHVRKGLRDKMSAVSRGDFDDAIDFTDTIERDIPKGCWCLQFERDEKVVILKSLLWMGYVFYHVLGTKEYGSLYCGMGQYNIDLPFML